MMIHLLGVDNAGHTYDSFSKEIERKLSDTEKVIKKIVEKMDDKTTLLVLGDHGMTPDGNHGGETLLETRSAFFAYQKTPFPMYSVYNKKKLTRSFEDMDKTIKQLDLTSILSLLLNVPIPFSNLGILHPLFVPTSDLQEVLVKTT